MKRLAYHVLRIGMAINFIWIGVYILQQPEAWGGYMQPWARDFIDLTPVSVKLAMIIVGVLDVAVGIFLLINIWVWHAAFLGAIHLAMVLVISGINAITVRDIGLFAASLALALETWPDRFRFWDKIR